MKYVEFYVNIHFLPNVYNDASKQDHIISYHNIHTKLKWIDKQSAGQNVRSVKCCCL